MDELSLAALKPLAFASCMDFINERIRTAEMALEQAREASHDDTKSSAGDKFETGREMLQQEMDRHKRLLLDARAGAQLLESLRDSVPAQRAGNGALVRTSQGLFYLGISAGKLEAAGQPFFAVSLASPVGRMLAGKQQGEAFTVNNNNYVVWEVG